MVLAQKQGSPHCDDLPAILPPASGQHPAMQAAQDQRRFII
jgi:hypothetical protein